MGNNLYICPSDYDKVGSIMDEVILRDLIKAMPANVYTNMLVDCCYSGTVGDLPYVLKSSAPGAKQNIEPYFDTHTRTEMLQKEKEGSKKYQDYKKARAQRRSHWRLGGAMADAAGVMADGAKLMGTVAADGAKMVGTVTAESVLSIGNVGAEIATGAVTSAADAAREIRRTGSAVLKRSGSAVAGAVRAELKRSDSETSLDMEDFSGDGDSNHNRMGGSLGERAFAAVNTSISGMNDSLSSMHNSFTNFHNSMPNMNFHRDSESFNAGDYEEAARKEAVERSKREAAEARAQRLGGLSGSVHGSSGSGPVKKPIQRSLTMPKRTSGGVVSSEKDSADAKSFVRPVPRRNKSINASMLPKRTLSLSKRSLGSGNAEEPLARIPRRTSSTDGSMNMPLKRGSLPQRTASSKSSTRGSTKGGPVVREAPRRTKSSDGTQFDSQTKRRGGKKNLSGFLSAANEAANSAMSSAASVADTVTSAAQSAATTAPVRPTRQQRMRRKVFKKQCRSQKRKPPMPGEAYAKACPLLVR